MPATPHIYIDCDIPEGQTLVEWRRDQVAGRRASRRRRRPALRLPDLRLRIAY